MAAPRHNQNRYHMMSSLVIWFLYVAAWIVALVAAVVFRRRADATARPNEDEYLTPTTRITTGGDYLYWVDKQGRPHRDNDMPAVFGLKDGSLMWYRHGVLWREGNKPTCIHNDGSMIWRQGHGLHRGNGLPACIYPDGTRAWYENDVPSRPNNLPHVETGSGERRWLDSQRFYHRAHGLPAVVCADGAMRSYWHGDFMGTIRAAWTPTLTRCHQQCCICQRDNDETTPKAPTAIVCSEGHCMCQWCLRQFMDSINGPAQCMPACPVCRRPLEENVFLFL